MVSTLKFLWALSRVIFLDASTLHRCDAANHNSETFSLLFPHYLRSSFELILNTFFPFSVHRGHTWGDALDVAGYLILSYRELMLNKYKFNMFPNTKYSRDADFRYIDFRPEVRQVYIKFLEPDLSYIETKINHIQLDLLATEWKNLILDNIPNKERFTKATVDDRLIYNVKAAYAHYAAKIALKEANTDQTLKRKLEIEEAQDFFNYVPCLSYENIWTSISIYYIYISLFYYSLYNLTLPEWTGNGVLQRMRKLSDFSFKIVALSQELRRLKSGPIIGEIQKNMRAKEAGDIPERKIFFYSAHDTTVATLLLGLGVFNDLAPPYATTVLIELHKVEDERFVQMFLRNDTKIEATPYELILPGCDSLCNLDKWLTLTSKVVPENWAKECYRPDAMDAKMEMETLAALITCGILAVLLAAMFITLCFQRRQNNTDFHYQPLPNDIK
ncbi:unnamed protein product, partial [Meganyctiphanes norvegica]